MDGTRTFVVGREVVAVIDPGPDDSAHLDRLAELVADADTGTILLTHGHRDHAAGAPGLSERTGLPIAGPDPDLDRHLRAGDRIEVDDGWLEAVPTPGHARQHLAFLHDPYRRLFVGDLLLGRGNTTWVGAYSGCIGDYLRSLDRVESLAPRSLLPAHGGALDRPGESVEAFRSHRLERIAQVEAAAGHLDVRRALEEGRPLSEVVDRLFEAVYPPDLPDMAREGARWSLLATLEYLGIAPYPAEGSPYD